MNFADVAERVLRDAGGGPLHYREITERARQAGLIAPRSAQPWTWMSGAINADIRRRAARGERSRFQSSGRGHFRLRFVGSEPEDTVERWNGRTKAALLARLSQIDPTTFEELIGSLLERIGFEDVEVTSRSKDGGVDVRGVLTVGGVTRVQTAIQVKRWNKAVGDRIVRELRGSLGPREQGLVITTARFSRSARNEADVENRAPITLVDGDALVELLAEHGLGFRRRQLTQLDLDEELLAGVESGAVSASEEGRQDATTPRDRPPGRFRALYKLPGGKNAYLTTLRSLLRYVEDQPTVTTFIARLQEAHPYITLTSVAERHMRVLLALGMAETDREHLLLTADGRRYVETGKSALVRAALKERVLGAAEIVAALGNSPATIGELDERLRSQGVDITRTQVSYIVEWLTQAGELAYSGARYRLNLPDAADGQ